MIELLLKGHFPPWVLALVLIWECFLGESRLRSNSTISLVAKILIFVALFFWTIAKEKLGFKHDGPSNSGR